MSSRISESEYRLKVDAQGVLEGTLALPPHPTGVVLFAHGFGSSRMSPRNRYVARALNQASLATLLLDLLTPSEEAVDKLTHELRFDLDLLTQRMTLATDWLTRTEGTADLPVGYFGTSTGAGAALIAATTRSLLVRAVVSRGGRPDLAGDALPEVRAPTLLIVGGRDKTVLALNEAALERLTCEKSLGVVPDAGPLFEEPGTLRQVAALTRRWFRQYLPIERDEARMDM